MRFDRNEVLREVSEGWDSDRAWKTIKSWIIDMVQVEPKIMRKVAQARFGYLGNWLQRGSGNVSVCGCLVGTTALEMVKERNHFKPNCAMGEFEQTKPFAGESFEEDESLPSAEPYEVIERLMKADPEFVRAMRGEAEQAGLEASNLGVELGQDKAVWLIKDEILRQLKLRQIRIRAGRRAARQMVRRKGGQFAYKFKQAA